MQRAPLRRDVWLGYHPAALDVLLLMTSGLHWRYGDRPRAAPGIPAAASSSATMKLPTASSIVFQGASAEVVSLGTEERSRTPTWLIKHGGGPVADGVPGAVAIGWPGAATRVTPARLEVRPVRPEAAGCSRGEGA